MKTFRNFSLLILLLAISWPACFYAGKKKNNKNSAVNAENEEEKIAALEGQMADKTADSSGKNAALDTQISMLIEKINKFDEDNGKMMEAIAGMQAAIKGITEFGAKLNERKRELLEMLANLAAEHNKEEFEKLEKSPINFISMKENKLDTENYGRELGIWRDGYLNHASHGWNCVRAILPVPKLPLSQQHSVVYFEVQILETIQFASISIGFCTKQFRLVDNWLGNENNSIGIFDKGGIYFDRIKTKFGKDKQFKVGDFIGMGLILSLANSPMKCFATCNGDFLGMAELPEKFAELELFPAVALLDSTDSVHVNFGKEDWRFNLSQFFQQ